MLDCREMPVTNCQPKSVHVPVQEKQHKKKCLLADDAQPGENTLGIMSAKIPPLWGEETSNMSLSFQP